MTVVRSGSATDVGRVRSVNQDLALEEPNLFAVADGMGGHVGGEVAARVAVDTLRSSFSRQPSVDGLRRAVVDANVAVWQRGQTDMDLRGMGTTMTAVALVAGPDGRDVVALANVGDSRGYVYSGGRVVQVTADHSLAEEKVRHGELTEAEAAVHPHRHILTRALGVSSDVDVDLWELHLRAGDRILLCSDGLTNEVSTSAIADVLGSVADPAEASRTLVQAALDHGGNDNITVVVVDVQVADSSSEAPSSDPQPTETPSEAAPSETGAAPSPAAAGLAGAAAAGMAGAATAGATDAATAIAGAEGPPLVAAGVSRAGQSRPTTGPATGPSTGPSTGVVPAARPTPSGGCYYPPPDLLEATEGPDDDEEELTRRERRREKRDNRRRAGIPRRLTFRVVLFVVLLLAVVAAAYGFLRWYANDNWFVTIEGKHLVIYQGRSGGLLWFKPKLVERTTVTTAGVLPTRLQTLAADVNEPSLAKARRYVANLHQEFVTQQQISRGQAAGTTTTTFPTGTTTTTAPSPVTAPPTTTAPAAP